MNPFHQQQGDTHRAKELARKAARAGENDEILARLGDEHGGKAPWWRRVFRRKPPLPYQ